MHNFTARVLAPNSPLSSVASSFAVAIAAVSVCAVTSYPSSVQASTPSAAINSTPTLASSSTAVEAHPDHSSAPSVLEAPQAAEAPQAQTIQAAAPGTRLEDGIYVYGQSLERDQLGQAYLVFEAQADTVVGAFYMPSSSFDCFQGNVEADRLALTITDSYTSETYAYGLPTAVSEPIASQVPEAPFGLEGFYALEGMSDLDERVLTTCKADAGL